MGKNKIYRLLAALSKKELREFKLFLDSPYFNQSQTMKALFDYIRPCYPVFNQKELAQDEIFKAIKPSKEFSKKFVIDRLSDLTQLLNDFLAIQESYKNPEKRREALRQSLIRHYLHQEFLKLTAKEVDNFESKPREDWKYNLKLWSLKHEIFIHPYTPQFVANEEGSEKVMNFLDDAYVILKLRYGLHQLFRRQIFSDLIKAPLLESIVRAGNSVILG